ncbi:hypothetical protein QE152_g13246 [Popillia japonica]|uniref:Uncharacterized protein n=1 Tax=Popillia japonica TaxID=7064 RepID=A0AAW1LD61_POPJA
MTHDSEKGTTDLPCFRRHHTILNKESIAQRFSVRRRCASVETSNSKNTRKQPRFNLSGIYVCCPGPELVIPWACALKM